MQNWKWGVSDRLNKDPFFFNFYQRRERRRRRRKRRSFGFILSIFSSSIRGLQSSHVESPVLASELQNTVTHKEREREGGRKKEEEVLFKTLLKQLFSLSFSPSFIYEKKNISRSTLILKKTIMTALVWTLNWFIGVFTYNCICFYLNTTLLSYFFYCVALI